MQRRHGRDTPTQGWPSDPFFAKPSTRGSSTTKRAPPPGPVLHPHGSPVAHDVLRDERETEPVTGATGTLPGPCTAGEPLEHLLPQRLRHPRPLVVDLQANPVAVPEHRHPHRAACVAAGVVEQVRDDPVQPAAIPDDESRGPVGVEVGGLAGAGREHVAHQLDQIKGFERLRVGRLVPARDLEQVDDHPLEAVHLRLEQVHGADGGRWQLVAAAAEYLGGVDDRGQRGAQLVADVAGEPGVPLHALLQLSGGGVERRRQWAEVRVVLLWLQQLLPRDDPPGSCYSQLQQEPELRPGQVHLPPGATHHLLLRVDLDLAEPQDLPPIGLVGRLAAAEKGSDARGQLARDQGFRDVVVGPGLQATDHVHRVGPRRHDDDGQIAFGTQPPAHVEAADARQHEVEEHDVHVVACQPLQRLLAGCGLDDGEALIGESQPEGLTDAFVVLDEQHLSHPMVISWSRLHGHRAPRLCPRWINADGCPPG
jgi:hypothetical protein